MKHDYHWQQEHLKEYKSKIAFAEAYSEHMLKEYIAECNESRSAREKEVKELETELAKGVQAKSIAALKMAYRKHVKLDDSIGWDELGDVLCDAICEAESDEAFCKLADGESK